MFVKPIDSISHWSYENLFFPPMEHDEKHNLISWGGDPYVLIELILTVYFFLLFVLQKFGICRIVLRKVLVPNRLVERNLAILSLLLDGHKASTPAIIHV